MRRLKLDAKMACTKHIRRRFGEPPLPAKTWQNALLHSLRERRIPWSPPEGAQFGVANTLIALAPLARRCRAANGRQWALQPFRKPTVAFALQNRLVIDHVVNPTTR